MTETQKKAVALVNEVAGEMGKEPIISYEDWSTGVPIREALCRTIEELEAEKAARATEREQHEAFRQEVSDAVEEYADRGTHAPITYLGRFIIPKPDPLVDALGELADRNLEARQAADTLRAAIEKRGGKIVWGEG